MSLLIVNSFVVFALTLVITKSEILAGKREFVKLRYIASNTDGQNANLFHSWWHALFTCPMCSGFWISIPICFIYPVYGLFIDVMVVFGINWLIHCAENTVFLLGKLIENIDDIVPELVDLAKKAKKSNLLRLIEKKMKNY